MSLTKIIKPQKLQKGDTIGIISPSSPWAGKLPLRFKKGIKVIHRLGYHTRIGKNAMKVSGHKAGTIAERISDIHEMFEDTDVKAIITSIGGYNSNELLDRIDYRLIRKNPKIFCGYSDITTLHCGINSLTGLVTFYGPQIMSQFAEFGGPLSYTLYWFEKIVTRSVAAGKVLPSKHYTFERPESEKKRTKRRKMVPSPVWKVLKIGNAQGELIGGHLGTLAKLTGTKYFPNFDNKILFWEDTESHTAITDSTLSHLRMLGIFDQIKGMIIGRINPDEYIQKSPDYPFHKVVLESTKEYDFPILADMDFGHTDPMFTLPYGIKATMNTETIEFSILESSVT